MAKRFLITGGAGFIGSHLAERLVGDGHHVVALDDLSTGSLRNLAGLAGQPEFQLVRGSVEDEATVNILLSQCDAVFHLASAVGVQLIVDEPVRTIRTTIRGTEVVLEAANKYGRPVLITSSSEVYGKGVRVPFSEDDDVVMGSTRHSRWCYAYSKGIDEFLGLAYHKQYGLPVRIVRLFNTVGPRQVGMYGMVLPRFVAAALKGDPLQVYGDGKQTRCFCHVGDVVDAILRLSDAPGAVGQVFNLGSDEETSINDLASLVIRLTKSSSAIEHLTYEAAYGQKFDDMARRVPKLDKIRSVIPFMPRHKLEDIVRAVIEEKKER
ncbi:MAG TPA: NAD-dependent epimerase/dehydratase family protein [Tepidisphaeraceae bacterium]|jgi:UDP-glucose 4-epimerase|nr:NAD-dependent epimerase/dehydratase family protein [Tepidisphaeraceae bacterium]